MSTLRIYDTSQGVYLDQVPSPVEHVQVLDIGSNDQLQDMTVVDDFERSYADNKRLFVDDQWRDKVAASRAKLAENLGLTGQAYSDFVEQDIPTTVSDYHETAVSRLVDPVDDKTIEQPAASIPDTDTLTEVIRKGSENSNEIFSSMLEALDFQNTLLQNQNQMLAQRNEIEAQKVKIMMENQAQETAKNKIVTEMLTSAAQALQYLPAMVEAIATHSDRQAEAANIANSHRLQKNINDAYEFKYDKTADDGLRVSAKKQADLAKEELSVHEEEDGFFAAIREFGTDAAYALGLLEDNIFEVLVDDTIEEAKK